MDNIDKLTDILKRLNSGENPEQVKAEARDLLSKLTPKDLSLAEQKLLDEGLSHEDLRNLCSVHMEVVKDQLEKMKAKLSKGHVIYTMVSEHDVILGFLDELEDLNNKVQKMNSYDSASEELEKLSELSQSLLDTEPHHQREEDVVFPEMEKKGVSEPQKIMKMEHEDLRSRKKDLKDLSGKSAGMEFSEFKAQLDALAKYIVFTLRDHIFKENNILYPTAIEIIDEKESWERMREECDKIGYCIFTPER